jgi:hypothetical protein
VIETNRCSFCHSENSQYVCQKVPDSLTAQVCQPTMSMYRCNDCGLYYTFPLPTKEILDAFYVEIYNLQRWKDDIDHTRWTRIYRVIRIIPILNILFPLSEFFLKLKFLKPGLMKLFHRKRKFINYRSAIDIGCAWGGFIPSLQLFGYFTEGIEPCSELVRELNRKGVRNVYSVLLEDFHTDKKYDLVYARGTLMYMLDLKSSLEKVLSLMKDDGVLALIETNPDYRMDMSSHKSPLYLNGLSNDFMCRIKDEYGFRELEAFLLRESSSEIYELSKHQDLLTSIDKILYLLKK